MDVERHRLNWRLIAIFSETCINPHLPPPPTHTHKHTLQDCYSVTKSLQCILHTDKKKNVGPKETFGPWKTRSITATKDRRQWLNSAIKGTLVQARSFVGLETNYHKFLKDLVVSLGSSRKPHGRLFQLAKLNTFFRMPRIYSSLYALKKTCNSKKPLRKIWQIKVRPKPRFPFFWALLDRRHMRTLEVELTV